MQDIDGLVVSPDGCVVPRLGVCERQREQLGKFGRGTDNTRRGGERRIEVVMSVGHDHEVRLRGNTVTTSAGRKGDTKRWNLSRLYFVRFQIPRQLMKSSSLAVRGVTLLPASTRVQRIQHEQSCSHVDAVDTGDANWKGEDGRRPRARDNNCPAPSSPSPAPVLTASLTISLRMSSFEKADLTPGAR